MRGGYKGRERQGKGINKIIGERKRRESKPKRNAKKKSWKKEGGGGSVESEIGLGLEEVRKEPRQRVGKGRIGKIGER